MFRNCVGTMIATAFKVEFQFCLEFELDPISGLEEMLFILFAFSASSIDFLKNAVSQISLKVSQMIRIFDQRCAILIIHLIETVSPF
jgi:hypothetical protein